MIDDPMTFAERMHREAMTRGSDMLREAIILLKRGMIAYTPEGPVGLPKDAAERAKIAEDGRKPRLVVLPPETDDDRILRLYSKGHTFGTIAKMMEYDSPQKAQGALSRIKHRNPGMYWRAAERHAEARGLTK